MEVLNEVWTSIAEALLEEPLNTSMPRRVAAVIKWEHVYQILGSGPRISCTSRHIFSMDVVVVKKAGSGEAEAAAGFCTVFHGEANKIN